MAKIKERGSTHVYKVNRIPPEEINGMTNLCVAEQPPYCNASCPLKLDVRQMMDAVQKGDFKKALQVYEKATPFPNILSKGCERPCEEKCKLCSLGDGIAIRDIEAAVAAYGEKTNYGGVFRTKKKKTVAIFGDDLFCLFLAGELEKKMYPTHVFSEMSDMDAYLKNLNAEDEKDRIEKLDIEFSFSSAFQDDAFSSFDIICASEKEALSLYPDAVCNEKYMIWEGKNLVMGKGTGVLNSAFNAKKAALTVDRLAQNLSPDNMRGDEGTVETSLYTNTDNAKNLKRIKITDKDTAIEEAKRCLLCHCDECMKACSFLQHYQKKPALIGKEIYNNTQIIMGTHPLNHAMNACTLCGQCKEVCPNGFDMATICRHARENMVSTDKMPLSQHEFALLDMYFSNEDAFLCRNQKGYDKCKYVFFPGCQACAIAPDTVRRAYEDLCQRLTGGVALILGCCSVMAKWSGRTEIYEQQKEFLKQQLSSLGNPTIIAGCPMCKKELSEYNDVIGIWDVLNKIGLPDCAGGLNVPAVLHDSCGARGDEKTQSAVREIVSKLGISLEEITYEKDASPCCGYGGLTAYADPPMAKKVAEKALERSDAPFITYCMSCRDRFTREGHESHHILEMVYGAAASDAPDISEKRYNRLSLKSSLLSDIWGETTEKMDLGFEIEYTDEALKIMDERFILKSDVEQVIKNTRESGECIYDKESSLYIACYRPGNVTFWVKYDVQGDKYIVHRAWSHRMLIQNRE